MGNREIRYEHSVDNAATCYMVIPDSGLDYNFNGKVVHMKTGQKIEPADHMEQEYCQNLANEGVLAPV